MLRIKKKTHKGYTVLEAVICIAISAVLFALIFTYIHGLTSLTTHSAGEYVTESDKSRLTQMLVGDMQSATLASVDAEGTSLTLTSDRWVIQYDIEEDGDNLVLTRQMLRLGETESEDRKMLTIQNGSFSGRGTGVVEINLHIDEGNDFNLRLHHKGV